jgi:hypothetical protein
MTDYPHEAYHYPKAYGRGDGGWRMHTAPTREYALNDTIQGAWVAKGEKITESMLAFSDEFDEDAAPTGTAKLQYVSKDGLTIQDLITTTTAEAGTVGGAIKRENVFGGINYVAEQDGFLRVLIATAVANAKTAIFKFGANVTPKLWGAEQRSVED